MEVRFRRQNKSCGKRHGNSNYEHWSLSRDETGKDDNEVITMVAADTQDVVPFMLVAEAGDIIITMVVAVLEVTMAVGVVERVAVEELAVQLEGVAVAEEAVAEAEDVVAGDAEEGDVVEDDCLLTWNKGFTHSSGRSRRASPKMMVLFDYQFDWIVCDITTVPQYQLAICVAVSQ